LPWAAWSSLRLWLWREDASARTVLLPLEDIIPIAEGQVHHAIELPPAEKIMEAATGDKEFWLWMSLALLPLCIRRNRASVHTEPHYRQGKITVLPLQDISLPPNSPDLKVIVSPPTARDRCCQRRRNLFPAAQLEQSQQALALCSLISPTVEYQERLPASTEV